jgi:hypothetical protein
VLTTYSLPPDACTASTVVIASVTFRTNSLNDNRNCKPAYDLCQIKIPLRSAHTSNTREQTSTEREEPAETQTPTPDPRPNQPKIWEVQDNFGNTLTFEHDGSEQVHVEEEIVVNDETEIQVCVTDIAKKLDDEIEYHFRFGNTVTSHPDNEREWTRDNCHVWNMSHEDYTSNWSIGIHIRNGDRTYYQNPGFESDYRTIIHYKNLTLAEEG